MEANMETNKWLWQPKKNGPIHLRVTYQDETGKRQCFVRSLRTQNWTEARRIRDSEFTPIILSMEKAQAQIELAMKLYPRLVQKLRTGLHGGYGPSDTQEAKAAGIRIEALAKEWSKSLTIKGGNYCAAPNTAQRYATIAASFAAHIGADTPAVTITMDMVATYRDQLLTEHGKSKKTVALELTALRGLFKYGMEKHKLAVNPVNGVLVKRTKADRIREKRQNQRRPPTHDEADKICTRFPPHRNQPVEDFQDYGMVARYTGMRQGEIAQLRAEDICLYPATARVDAVLKTPGNFAKPYKAGAPLPAGQLLCILVADRGEQTTKTGQERIVPVADKLRPILDRRLSDKAKGPVFPVAAVDNGKDFSRLWLKKVKKIDKELTLHGFRHYATTEMENNGVNTGIACAVLGHEPGTVHSDYFHGELAAMKTAVDKIY